MRVLPISDIHVEHHFDKGKSFVESLDESICDVLVLAGDITTQVAGIPNAMSLFCNKFKNVIYVLGNHEYWQSNRDRVNIAVRKACNRNKNLHVLDNNLVEIDGVRFLGTSLWFPATQHAVRFEHQWSDFGEISKLNKWVYKYNQQANRFLEVELQKGDVVISHHLPSYKSVHPKFEKDIANCYFVSDAEHHIIEKEPKLWIHGHTHESCNYILGQSQIICNPCGYIWQPNPQFNSELVIEI